MTQAKSIFKSRSFACQSCPERISVFQWNYDPAPDCTMCKGPMIESYGQSNRAPGVIPDSILGGVVFDETVTNSDGTPRRFESKTELRQTARARGWTLKGETPKPANCDGWFRHPSVPDITQ